MGSVEGCDDQESVCSSNEREGDAFPKAFERDLVTPTNLQKAHTTDSTDSTASALTAENANKSADAETKDSTVATGEAAAASNTGTGNTSTPKTDAKPNSKFDTSELGRELRTLEERRRSLLDHHWAVPSKERYIFLTLFFLCNEPSSIERLIRFAANPSMTIALTMQSKAPRQLQQHRAVPRAVQHCQILQPALHRSVLITSSIRI